jgi:hypothetical protein
VGDVPAAYLQTDHHEPDGEELHIIMDKRTTAIAVKIYPDLAVNVRPDGTMIWQVMKALYGLILSAWLWYNDLTGNAIAIGYKITDADKGVLVKFSETDPQSSCIISIHVDDVKTSASDTPEGHRLEQEFWDMMESKYPGIVAQHGPDYRHLAWDINYEPGCTVSKSQKLYFQKLLASQGITQSKNLPARSDLLTVRKFPRLLNAEEHADYRSTLQQVAYGRDGRADIDFVVHHLQRYLAAPTEQEQLDLIHLLEYLHGKPDVPMVFHPADSQLRAYCDALYGDTNHYGFVIQLGGTTIATKGGRLKTIHRSSAENEISGVNEVISIHKERCPSMKTTSHALLCCR